MHYLEFAYFCSFEQAMVFMIAKFKRYIYLLFIATITAVIAMMNTSCLGDEPDCCEADIESVTLHVADPSSFFYQATDSMQVVFSTDTAIVFTVRGNADVSSLSPEFKLSPEASVSPASGSTHDFSKGAVEYTVTSQDGHWTRRYTVRVVPTTQIVTDTLHYNFELFELEECE